MVRFHSACSAVPSDTGASTDTSQAPKTSNEKLKNAEATILDMGNYLLSDCRNRPYTAEDAALPPIAGEHVVQILPQDLLGRAALFPAMDPATQVSYRSPVHMLGTSCVSLGIPLLLCRKWLA